MTTIFKSISLGFLALCFVWAICISICVSIRLFILHIKRDLQPNRPEAEDEQPEKEKRQATILSTPVQSKRTNRRKRKREQPAKVYFVMQEQEED